MSVTCWVQITTQRSNAKNIMSFAQKNVCALTLMKTQISGASRGITAGGGYATFKMKNAENTTCIHMASHTIFETYGRQKARQI